MAQLISLQSQVTTLTAELKATKEHQGHLEEVTKLKIEKEATAKLAAATKAAHEAGFAKAEEIYKPLLQRAMGQAMVPAAGAMLQTPSPF